MSRTLLRQEREGGYWFDGDAGRALELGPAAYAHAAAWGSGRAVAPRPPEILADTGGPALLELLVGRDPASVRHVPSPVPLSELPTDAVAAPKRIYFEVTRRCNLACRSCFNDSHRPLDGELSEDEILAINQRAWELGVFELRYTGGEATTQPYFRRVVEDARRRGFYISLGTNGVYTDEQLEWLPGCGVDWFIVSLDGDEATNDSVRGRGSFASVARTLAVLARHPVRVRLNMTVARHNQRSIEAVVRVAAEHGVQGVNLIPLRPYGRSRLKMTEDMFSQREFYGFIREINRLRRLHPTVTLSTTIDLMDPTATTSHDLVVQKKSTCAAGVEACVVGPLGHVYGCSYSPASFPDQADEEGRRVFIAGDLRRDDLGTIWRDSSRWAVFRDLALYKSPKCHSCGHYKVRCSGSCQIMAWYQLRELEEDRARNIREVYDPYCFVDLMPGQTSDLGSPCGGAGMDGF